MTQVEHERHRRERGVILELLVQAATAVAFVSLWRMMDSRNQTVTQEGLRFHLENYLEPQGYVKLTRMRDLPGWKDNKHALPSDIVTATITPKGIQLLNGSIDDTEVVIA